MASKYIIVPLTICIEQLCNRHLCFRLHAGSLLAIPNCEDDSCDRGGLHQAFPRALPIRQGRESGGMAEGETFAQTDTSGLTRHLLHTLSTRHDHERSPNCEL